MTIRYDFPDPDYSNTESMRILARKLGMHTPLVQENFERMFAALNVAGDALYMLSGLEHDSWERSVAAGTAMAMTATGLMVSSASQKQSSDDIENLRRMSRLNYALERVRQAGNPMKHYRQTLGLALILAGSLYIKSGYDSQRYPEAVLGASVIAAGTALGLAVEDDKAWQRFGVILASTVQPLGIPYSADAAINHGDPYIALATMCFLASTALASLAKIQSAESAGCHTGFTSAEAVRRSVQQTHYI